MYFTLSYQKYATSVLSANWDELPEYVQEELLKLLSRQNIALYAVGILFLLELVLSLVGA